MPLGLRCEGATADQVAYGIAAAMDVFEAAGVTPEQGAEGIAAREWWDINGFPEECSYYGEQEERWASVWDEAEAAALRACLGSAQDARGDFALMLV